jgi:hypothetical protein
LQEVSGGKLLSDELVWSFARINDECGNVVMMRCNEIGYQAERGSKSLYKRRGQRGPAEGGKETLWEARER